jgi:transcriptional regulator of acetoin/glycerol metabolism
MTSLPLGFIPPPIVIVPLEEIKKAHVAMALKRYRWNMQRTANVLGIGRATLYRYVSIYDLKKDNR